MTKSVKLPWAICLLGIDWAEILSVSFVPGVNSGSTVLNALVLSQDLCQCQQRHVSNLNSNWALRMLRKYMSLVEPKEDSICLGEDAST